MKIFYTQNWWDWKFLAKYVSEDMATTYEIVAPDTSSKNIGKYCKNMIRLWDEDKYGSEPPFRISIGQDESVDWLFHNVEDYLCKISEKVKQDDEIVLAVSNDDFSWQLIEFFVQLKKTINFKLHIFLKVNRRLEHKQNRYFLREIKQLYKLNSVAIFNEANIMDEEYLDRLNIEDYMIAMDTCEEIVAEEATKTLGLLKELSQPENGQLWFWVMPSEKYELVTLEEEDFQNKLSDYIMFSKVSPNQGRQMCERLKAYRKAFCEKHDIKSREYPCSYVGECEGTCKHCEEYSSQLWQKQYGKIGNSYGSGIAHLSGMIRLRDNIDGPGLRTLVLMKECPLSCRYCFNKQYVKDSPYYEGVFTNDLVKKILPDAVYFEMSGGGVTFGGGEPLLYSEFICDFKRLCPNISIVVETSLNVSFKAVEMLTDVVDEWIVDVKDMNDEIYKAYTGKSNFLVMQNLQYLSDINLQSKVLCRVPAIEEFNTTSDIEHSIMQLKGMGFDRIERFAYQV